MQGSLKNLELPNLIDLIRKNGNNAAIYIQTQGKNATIFLEAGEVIHAEYGDLVGKPALQALFFLQDGDFYVREQEQTPDKTISEPWNALLLEMLQSMDEMSAAQTEVEDSLSEEGTDPINTLFQESGLGFLAVIGIDGAVYLLLSESQEDINEDFIGSVTASLFTSSDWALQELLGGSLKSILVEGEHGRVVLSTIEPARFLLALIPTDENLGISLAWIRTFKEYVKKSVDLKT